MKRKKSFGLKWQDTNSKLDPNSIHCVQLTILCAQINTSEPHHVCPRFYGQLALLLIRAVIKRDTLVSPLIIRNNLELVFAIRQKVNNLFVPLYSRERGNFVILSSNNSKQLKGLTSNENAAATFRFDFSSTI